MPPRRHPNQAYAMCCRPSGRYYWPPRRRPCRIHPLLAVRPRIPSWQAPGPAFPPPAAARLRRPSERCCCRVLHQRWRSCRPRSGYLHTPPTRAPIRLSPLPALANHTGAPSSSPVPPESRESESAPSSAGSARPGDELSSRMLSSVANPSSPGCWGQPKIKHVTKTMSGRGRAIRSDEPGHFITVLFCCDADARSRESLGLVQLVHQDLRWRCFRLSNCCLSIVD